MKGNFRTLLRRYCLESTILGLKYFYLYPDCLSRCFWSINMVAVTFLACVLTILLYYRFAEMPTQITIENQYEPVSSLPYPSITICSPNQISKSFLKRFNYSISDVEHELDLELALPELIGMYEIIPKVNTSSLIILQSLLDLKNITTSGLLGSLAQSCDSFLKVCYFEMELYQNCEDLLRPILTAHGLCCTFNNKYYYDGKVNSYDPGMVTRTVKTTGEGRGLILVADYEPDDAIGQSILSGGAIKVMYSDFLEFPTSGDMSLVESNTESFHVINAAYTYCSEEVESLDPQYRICYQNHEKPVPHFNEYRKSDCELMCIVEAVKTECECLMFYVPHATTRRLCNVTSIACVMNVKYFSKSMGDCDCLPDCESRQYAADIILGNFDAVPYMLSDIYAGIKFNKSTIIMNFYFTSSVYVKKKQETVMSLTLLASNLGGIFGLCLGCSCISLLEILFTVYTIIKNHIRRRRRRNYVRYFEFKN